MSTHFKNFLKGLLNKVIISFLAILFIVNCSIFFRFSFFILVLMIILKQNPQHRLSWPKLLEHPFVKDDSEVPNYVVSIFCIIPFF